ncbi:hypothetical protein FPV67DRAFT_1450773 [Lyophyllum atratum]|nr:hypothetical protein FPV67DRAFT_1450773 [Lyophyllum atratum]
MSVLHTPPMDSAAGCHVTPQQQQSHLANIGWRPTRHAADMRLRPRPDSWWPRCVGGVLDEDHSIDGPTLIIHSLEWRRPVATDTQPVTTQLGRNRSEPVVHVDATDSDRFCTVQLSVGSASCQEPDPTGLRKPILTFIHILEKDSDAAAVYLALDDEEFRKSLLRRSILDLITLLAHSLIIHRYIWVLA